MREFAGPKLLEREFFTCYIMAFAEGQRVSLIKREITPELKVMRCRHIATFPPRALREMQRFYVEDLQTELESHMIRCV